MFEELAGRKPAYIDIHNHYAVAVPYLPGEGALLFEVRAETLARQPGEVSLPGGRIEAGETPRDAAVREAAEELLLPAAGIHIAAPLDVLAHPGNAVIHPFLATLTGYRFTFSPDEVKEVFTVPLAYFLANEPHVFHNEISVTSVDPNFPHEWVGTRTYPWGVSKSKVLFYRYGQRIIWGMTAKIIRNFVDIYTAQYGRQLPAE